jgi:3-hydroxyisobutyrate dehydrogenase-like beta-hydroxyacid dehydrogenase
MPIGVIGAGLMGTAITRRLLDAKHDVVAYDVDEGKRAAIREIGARVAESVHKLASECETVVLAVFNTDQVEQVVEGPGSILGAIPPHPADRIVICTSTCDPDRLAALASRVAQSGLHVLEVPISGTSRQLAEGNGVGLIGGDAGVAQRAAAVLDAICPRRTHVGPVGHGSRAKLAVNLILGLNRAAIAEGLVFAEQLGLDREAFLEVARGSAAYSQVMDVKGRLFAKREYRTPQSRVDQSLKDFKLMVEQAGAHGQQLPFASVYVRMLQDCMEHGEGEWDNAAIAEAIARQRARPPA